MSVIYEPKGRAREYSYLAINIYTGCLHGCIYCYAKQMAQRYGNNFNDVTIRKNLIENLRKEAPKYAGTNKRVLLCFMCDPYQIQNTVDSRQNTVTRQVIKILKANNIPFQVLTKGGLRAVRDFDLYEPCDAFATTMTFLRIDDSQKYEPNAAVPGDRIRAIMAAKEQNIETWISLEPVIDPVQSLAIIERTYEFCDLYKIGKLNHHKSNINWRKFAIEALLLCKKYKKPYYIKDDLKPYLKGIEFENTDTRIVKSRS